MASGRVIMRVHTFLFLVLLLVTFASTSERYHASTSSNYLERLTLFNIEEIYLNSDYLVL